MSRLILMRHAHAGQHPGTPDHDRPLSGRGRREASAMGAWLAGRENVDLLIASSAIRTHQTAELVAAARQPDPEDADASIVIDPALYLAEVEDVLEVIRAVDPEVGTLQLVGHQPTIEDLTRLLLDTDPRHGFPPGTVVIMDFPGPWAELEAGAGNGAVLRSIASPGDIPS